MCRSLTVSELPTSQDTRIALDRVRSSCQGAAILTALACREPIEQPIMLLAAHPDDETIGAGIAMGLLRDLIIVHVTDGVPRRSREVSAADYRERARYAAIRRAELHAALETGGVRARCATLGIADQEASLHMALIANALLAYVRRMRPAALMLHAYEGGHPDHDTVALSAHVAAALAEPVPALIEMTGYHELAGRLVTDRFLPHPNPVMTLALDAAERARKQRMFAAFPSQRHVLAGFGTSHERFREAPRYDFTAPPHPGPLHYERQDWGMTGARWRRLAAAVLAGSRDHARC